MAQSRRTTNRWTLTQMALLVEVFSEIVRLILLVALLKILVLHVFNTKIIEVMMAIEIAH
jgi:hypothetical protein